LRRGRPAAEQRLADRRWKHVVEIQMQLRKYASMRLSADYQFIANPGYNADRGPVNVFAGRFHWQF